MTTRLMAATTRQRSATSRRSPLDLWAPQTIPGLRAWFNGNMVLPEADSQAVSSWPAAFGAATTTISVAPTVRTAVYHGRRVPRFDGVDDAIQVSDRTLLDVPVTLVVVTTPPTPNGSERHIVVRQSSSNNGAVRLRDVNGTMTFDVIDAGSPFPSAAIASGSGLAIWTCTAAEGSAVTLRKNLGTTVSSGDLVTSVTNNPANQTLRFGRRSDGAGSLWADMDLAAVLMYGRVLTAAEQEGLIRYLADEWGVTV